MVTVLMSRLSSLANRFAPWVLLLCVVVFTWFLAAIVWFLLAPPKAQNLTPVDLPANQSQASVNGSIFSIFARPEAQPTQGIQANTNFTLHGVFLASPASLSAAVLGFDGMVRRYRVGDDIEDTGYKLVEVTWDKAVVQDGAGRQVEVVYDSERLELDQRKPAQAEQNRSSTNTRSTSRSFGGSSDLRASAPNNQPKLTKQEQLDDELSGAIEQLRSNPAGYLSKMGVMATGDGYEVTAAMNSAIRSNIGLQSGDKVIAVNGQSVGQPQQDARLLEEVQRTGQAEIQVQRGDQIITIRQQF